MVGWVGSNSRDYACKTPVGEVEGVKVRFKYMSRTRNPRPLPPVKDRSSSGAALRTTSDVYLAIVCSSASEVLHPLVAYRQSSNEFNKCIN